MEHSGEQIRHVIDDIAYLIDEAEALKYVISGVPVTEKPAGADSILDMIALIDHAQQTCYRPAVERLFSEPDANFDLPEFKKTYKASDYEDDMDRVLNHIIKNRASLLTFVEKMPHHEFSRSGKVNGNKKSILEILNDMVSFERAQLREVAERVLAIDNTSRKGD